MGSTGKTPIRRRQRGTAQLAAVAATLALAVFVVAENFVVVEVRLVTWTFQVRLAWTMLIAAALGVAAGLLIARLRR